MTNISAFIHNGITVELNQDFINLTKLWEMAGRPEAQTPAKWRLLPSTEALIAQVLKDQNFQNTEKSNILKVTRGRYGNTLAHWKLALEYCAYLSPKMRIIFYNWLESQLNFIFESDWFKEGIEDNAHRIDNTGFIYLVYIASTNWYKIGMSKKPHKRMSSLQTGSPLTVILIHRVFTLDMRLLEKSLHRYFSQYRIRGEWFDLPDECVNEFPLIADALDRENEKICLPCA